MILKADAVMVRNGLIDAVGDRSDLATNYPAAAVDKNVCKIMS